MQTLRVAIVLVSFANVVVSMIALCSQFHSFERLFGWVFVPYLVWFVFRIVGIYSSPKFVPFRLGGDVHSSARRTAVLVGVIYSVWTLGFALLVLWPLACDSNQMPYCWFHTPVGLSSCFGTAGVSGVVYSAIGALSGQQTFRTANMICIAQDAVYAAGNGQSILTYPPVYGTAVPNTNAPPCQAPDFCLATNRTQDYLNPALGVSGGLFLNNQSATIVLCPGNVVQNAEVIGVNVCPQCLNTYETEYGYSNAIYDHCIRTPVQNGYWCSSVCPRPFEILTSQNSLVAFAVILALGCEGGVSWGIEELLLAHTL